MEYLLKVVVIWLSIDILIIATGWYAATVIKPNFPNWWRRVVVDDDEQESTDAWKYRRN